MVEPNKRLALRGAALSFRGDPFIDGDEASLHYEQDGLILIENGIVTAFGDYQAVKTQLRDHNIKQYSDALILPGFIDTHVHYPQTQMTGAYGKQLIDWLNKYTFVTEQQFANADHATLVSDFFLGECLRAGTTTASVYCTVHPGSVDAFFQAADKRNMRMIAGKVLMDRNAPDALTDTAQSGYDQSEALITRWHGLNRLSYAITPRFAPSSTPQQLEAAGALWKKHPHTHMQTHIAENQHEVDWVKSLYPERHNYLDVYSHYGLVGPRAIFGHALHLEDVEWRQLAQTGSAVSHCPTSNSFLGSGLFDFARAKQADQPIRLGLATDVGAGTTLSMLQTMGAAYKIGQLGHYSLSAAKAFYLATRGAAQALYLEDKVGSISPGMEADLLVLDLKSTPLIDFRMQHCENIEEALFIQMTMGDDRATEAVYIAGELAYSRRTTNRSTYSLAG
ncbi:guanine deaminase [Pollutimonas bauzanensis]|uniref:guanine deaminase n=1 Tax=Pollutimonas bauzanensis TaxID=658167 RepID=UPI00333FE45A